MRSAILFYLVGLTSVLLYPHPLPGGLIAVNICITPLLLWVPGLRVFGIASIGFLWGAWHIEAFQAERPNLPVSGEIHLVRGTVGDFPRHREGRVIFELRPALTRSGLDWLRPPPRFEIFMRSGDLDVEPGHWCIFYARLRKPHGLVNFNARDTARRYVAARIIARGTVVAHPANGCYALAPGLFPNTLRATLSRAIDEAVSPVANAGVIKALAVADRGSVDEALWQRMRGTGTVHLMAISGLHISLAATWAFFIARALAAAVACGRQRYAAYRAGWLAAIAAALAYGALAGYSIPATRAVCMVGVAALAALRGRRALSFNSLLVALLILTVLDPFALLASGLWLSFGAVAVLMLIAQQMTPGSGRLMRAVRLHLLLSLGLLPLTALLFGQVPMLSALANLIAVPWCAIFVVPVVLAGVVLNGFAPGLAAVCWLSAAQLWSVLDRALAILHSLDWQVSTAGFVNALTLWPLGLGLVLLAAPSALRLRALGVLLIIAVIGARHREPPPPAFEVTVFDVGQGLAVLVQTATHVLLYDSGPRWPGRSRGTASSVILPGIAAGSIRHLDMLLISHGDLDHAGGVEEILEALPVRQVLVAPDGSFADQFGECYAGMHWQWDDVQFHMLHPPRGVTGSRNDRSCVLSVRSEHGSLLLSGDIEAAGEVSLLTRNRAQLSADALLVPHHGSATSSSPEFVDAVNPRIAVISASRGNHYGLPHNNVLKTYHARGIRLLTTATDGAVKLRFDDSGLTVRHATQRRLGFWHQAE